MEKPSLWPYELPVLLVAFLLAGLIRRRDYRSRAFRLTVLALIQFVVVAATGLLYAETARVWTFLLPLLMVPVGLELVAWSARQRLAVFAALLVLLTLLATNIHFVYAQPAPAEAQLNPVTSPSGTSRLTPPTTAA